MDPMSGEDRWASRKRGIRGGAKASSPAGDGAPLREVVTGIEAAFAAGDHALVAERLDREPLAAWFGLGPDRLGTMVMTLVREGAPAQVFVGAMDAVLSGDVSEDGVGFRFAGPPLDSAASPVPEQGPVSEQDRSPEQGLVSEQGPVPDRDGMRVQNASPERGAFPEGLSPTSAALAARMFGLRLQGRPVEAMRVSVQLLETAGQMQPLFDSHRGWGVFAAVQQGLTAMLVGDFAEANVRFTQARMHPIVPTLSFLSRDASVKAAVLHALYGDRETARALLDEADLVPRTESWAETVIDASHEIAAALVRSDDEDEALRRLRSVPLRALGEMWPFYVLALRRALIAVGQQDEARRQIAVFERLPLARADGQGYTGSALRIGAAQNELLAGNLAEARRRIEGADDSIVVTRLIRAVLELSSGHPREALQSLAGLREETRDFRRLELWRLAAVAGCHFALGEREDCRHVLEAALGFPGGLSREEVLFFSPEVRAFAEQRIEGWPGVGEGGPAHSGLFPATGGPLSQRELEVLRALANGQSREQIARVQFISMNTLKAHLRSIYRKLGVGSRAAAVLTAERRGLV